MTKMPKDESYIGRRIRLRDLHVFFNVAQRGSMAKAAASLGITQPAVSRVIADLEHALGVRLLDRSSQGVEPTMYGVALLSHGGIAFDEIKQAIREIEFLANPNVGEVRIGCPESIAAALLPPVMERLFHRYPGVVPIIGEVATSTLGFADLRARKFDLLVARLSAPYSQDQSLDDLNIQILFDDELVVAAGAESQWGRRRKIDLADLADAPWILTESRSWNRAIIEEAFRARGLRMPKICSMTFSVHVRANLVASGAFITTFPRSVMTLYARRFSLKVLPVDIPVRPWPVAILTSKSRTPSPVVQLFIDHMRTCSKALI
jgi:DNA-binding transcriptional LysR family regulator